MKNYFPSRDAIVNKARDAGDWARMAETDDPKMWRQLTGQTTAYTMTPGGTAIVGLVTYFSTKWGFGWDADTCGLVAFVIGTIGGYVTHYLTAKDFTKQPPDPSTLPSVTVPKP